MNNADYLINADHRYIWHPCSQMKDYELFKPLAIIGAAQSHLHLAGGGKIIDAISSWWCKALGHRNPALHDALQKQLEQFEQVILANTTNATIVELGELLSNLNPCNQFKMSTID